MPSTINFKMHGIFLSPVRLKKIYFFNGHKLLWAKFCNHNSEEAVDISKYVMNQQSTGG